MLSHRTCRATPLTPGIYETIEADRADTVVLGLSYATIVLTAGQTTMQGATWASGDGAHVPWNELLGADPQLLADRLLT